LQVSTLARRASTYIRRTNGNNINNHKIGTLGNGTIVNRRGVHTLPPLQSTISTSSPEFVERAKSMDEMVAGLKKDLATAREGGTFSHFQYIHIYIFGIDI
jgi:hypothetical protein